MKKKTVIIGAGGRMGRCLTAAICASDDLVIYGAVEYAQSPLLGTDAAALAGLPACGIAITSDIEKALEGADAMIDFSTCDVVPHVQCALKQNVCCVIGSTALCADDKAALSQLAANGRIVFSSNMSIGVNLLVTLVREVAAKLSSDYNIEIVEMHHKHKKDAPSGTAKMLLQAACESRAVSENEVIYGREGITGERPAQQIAVHALRGGDIAGDHTVLFAADGECLALSHRATGRETFARGALNAVRFLCAEGRQNGLYDMHDVLGL